MRLRYPDGGRTILTYCTNVHAIEELTSVLAALSRYCAPVRRRLGVRRLSLGLWLSRRSAGELVASPDARARLREALEANGLELATLNGFPYGDFHAERVKEEVYRPDWADVRRHHYTLDLARILCELLPADVEEGTISTLPLTYAPTAGASSAEECATTLAHLAVDLHRLADRHGRRIRVCLEPEPDCIVETSDQAIAFFHDRLRPAGTEAAWSTGGPTSAPRWPLASASPSLPIGVCTFTPRCTGSPKGRGSAPRRRISSS